MRGVFTRRSWTVAGWVVASATLWAPAQGLAQTDVSAAPPGDAASSETGATLVGTIRVTGPAIRKQVKLRVGKADTALHGELALELGHVQTAKVEVLGRTSERGFEVDAYRILEIYKGIKPWVGVVVRTSSGVGLSDGGDKPPLALSVGPRVQPRLLAATGAKVWIQGQELVSGELKVLRFGVLREAAVGAAGDGTPDSEQVGMGDSAQPTP